jgi:hypothetical protein
MDPQPVFAKPDAYKNINSSAIRHPPIIQQVVIRK